MGTQLSTQLIPCDVGTGAARPSPAQSALSTGWLWLPFGPAPRQPPRGLGLEASLVASTVRWGSTTCHPPSTRVTDVTVTREDDLEPRGTACLSTKH